MKRKAFIYGFNKTSGCKDLSSCVNDATRVKDLLMSNYDSTKNFTTCLVTDSEYTNKDTIVHNLNELLKSNDSTEISLFYFTGHGYLNNDETGIVLADGSLVSSVEISNLVRKSNVPNKILILDSCYSGGVLDMSSLAILDKGVTLISACKDDEFAISGKKYSVFTDMLIRALSGEAADIRGFITASSIYTYIDMVLDSWGTQRPVFKTHVSEFAYIRRAKPIIEAEILRDIPNLFAEADAIFPLDPSYEEVRNSDEEKEKYCEPNAFNVSKFKKLQSLARAGLVEPTGVKDLEGDKNHMYWAAIYSKGCRLTDIGKGYWYRAKMNSIR